nr:nucleotide exchange factor SIL1 isoform X4 [Mirounga angustirostris]
MGSDRALGPLQSCYRTNFLWWNAEYDRKSKEKRSISMALQDLPPSRMALLGMLLGLLMASCFTFCLSHQNPEFALTSPEKSRTKEVERKETTAEEELDSEVLEVFHPTHEWQALRPGQAVPAGSHVRLNLQSGAREVKLQEEDKFRSNLKGLKKGRRLDINTNTYTSQDLKSALAKFKEGAEVESSKEDKARQAKVKRLFRPIEELKKEFEELNVVIETDMQIMVRLINKFNSSSSSLEEKIAALFDLEYYVHQMDNAQDLLSFGGLQVVINGLNSTEPLVKEYAAFVLGAAFSSNPKVQVEAIEGGALQKLLVILATEQPLPAKKKVLFALCSLLRHFPYAQQQFLKLGGLQVLRSLVQAKGTEVLAVRVVTLLYDLVTEKLFLMSGWMDRQMNLWMDGWGSPCEAVNPAGPLPCWVFEAQKDGGRWVSHIAFLSDWRP